MERDAHIVAADRREQLGRIAGWLFLVAAAAAVPAVSLMQDAPRALFVLNGLAAVTGAVCLWLPWRRFADRSLHVVCAVATAEVTLSGAVAGPHSSILTWYFLLVAIFAGYFFRSRTALAAHLAAVVAGFVLVAALAVGEDRDALLRAMVAGPTLCVGAGVVAWLREGLESTQTRLEAMAAERRLESLTDPLTGLANRRRLLVDLDAALHSPAVPRTLALYDLDGFKAYNDHRGHLAGDHLLTALAERFAAVLPADATAYRLGGDEFCALVPGAGPQAAADIAAGAAALGSEPGVGCSSGSAALPLEATTASGALGVADRRMYADKRAGADGHR